ncbi:hypothetical protein SPRG_04792 [Saprolegnia parasitica CBS 223.65]|uniref:Uncharacterized protein n=1 Tax=Saprolegnia parasitica (strain CBS 223.65) TaxID=695850 RepID=A0A067CJH2_SAPPC|nr:hypothetical protein SPRG_04792 [Saprolegnia parasitica CBS 223.65]KDO30889.1 hypothetical protein SPRG_04792 [Saprolegnia parasitica CBS 223.65]|eukprot:XP_012198583.1 hypothetical protein SPRG_04792 [Saprolegnia parasitica CBS 223.65]
MFGRRQPSQPAPAAHATRKSSIHVPSSSSSKGYEKMGRSLSDSFERRGTAVLSPRKLHRKNSMDLQPAATIFENGVYTHEVVETIGSDASNAPSAPSLRQLVQQKHVPVAFASFPWMEHVIGLYTFVCADRLIVWNSHALNRALSLPETIYLEYPRDLGAFATQHARTIVSTHATEYSASKVAITATLFTADGSIVTWHDIQSSTPPTYTRMALQDGEHLVHVSGRSFPLYGATSSGRIYQVTLEDGRVHARTLASHANGGVFSGIFRLFSSKTPSPILLTKALPSSSEMLVLHVDSTLERLAMTPSGLEDQWRFEMASFMYNYFAQHEHEVLGYARCLDMPIATPRSFTMLIGFQAASSVVLYLFEFTATLAETPQFLRCLRLGTPESNAMDCISCHVVDASSIYVVTPHVVYAVSIPSVGEMSLELLPIPTASWVGAGGLRVRDTKSIVYLELGAESDGDVLDGTLGRVTNYNWQLPLTSNAPPPKRLKTDPRQLFSSSNVDEWCTVLLEQFQQSSCHLELVAKSDQSRQAFHRAVLALDSDILDAKPSTGLRWGQDAHVLTPQLVKYQLQEKATRHAAFTSFLATHPDELASSLPPHVRAELDAHDTKLHVAMTLCAMQTSDDPRLEEVLRQAMQRTVQSRGYTPEELAASGYSAFDMFYCDLTLFDDLFVHLFADDEYVVDRLRLLTRLLDAAHTYVAQHALSKSVWAVAPAVRDTARRLLQAALEQSSDEADVLACVDLATTTLVPAMDDDATEKAAWQQSVAVPLVHVAKHAEATMALVRALDFYEGMAYLGATESSVTNARFAHFLFQWHAGEVANPWDNDERGQRLEALFHMPRELLPALHTFLRNHATLSKHAWIVAVELGQYNEMAAQALRDAKDETTSLATKKTLASLGKLAAYAHDGSVCTSSNHELERIHIQELMCAGDASVPMSPHELIASCLEPLGADGIDKEQRVLMALDVVDSLVDDASALTECRARVWHAVLAHDAAQLAAMADDVAARANDVAIEARMKTLLVHAVARRYGSKMTKHAMATPAVVDALLAESDDDDNLLPSDVNRTTVRTLILQTLALANA